jgi:hypothetical protein
MPAAAADPVVPSSCYLLLVILLLLEAELNNLKGLILIFISLAHARANGFAKDRSGDPRSRPGLPAPQRRSSAPVAVGRGRRGAGFQVFRFGCYSFPPASKWPKQGG